MKQSDWDIKAKFPHAAVRVCVVVFCLAVMTLCGCSSYEQESQDNQAKGNVVVNALEAYQKEKGTFPAQLSDLTPKYLAEIPALKSARWDYQLRDSGNSFALSYVGAGGHFSGGYDSTAPGWDVDTK